MNDVHPELQIDDFCITRRKFVKGATMTAVVAAVCPSGLSGNDPMSENARKKRALGQYFTEGEEWLQPQVEDFIAGSGCRIAYDPFAGTGCLLSLVKKRLESINEVAGLDIDTSLGWNTNDSLLNIPAIEGAIIVTNPPYLSNYSASRKKIGDRVKKYFEVTKYDDLYLLALDRMLEAQRNVVAIIPETFINSPYLQKCKLHSMTILEQNPFLDTDTPVLVACFDSVQKSFRDIRIYKGAKYVCTLQDVEDCRIVPDNSVPIKFNDPQGWLAVRCVDSTDPADMLRFDFKDGIAYDWGKGIKVSSRLLTLVTIDVPEKKRKKFIDECNTILGNIRKKSHDIILSPFKGNMKNGVRRRRLDFMTCRAIMERAFAKVSGACKCATQYDLFDLAERKFAV